MGPIDVTHFFWNEKNHFLIGSHWNLYRGAAKWWMLLVKIPMDELTTGKKSCFWQGARLLGDAVNR